MLKLTQGSYLYLASHFTYLKRIYKLWETVNKKNKNAKQNSSNRKKNQKFDVT